MATPLRAYHGSQELKEKHMAWLKADIAADRLIAGAYGEQANGGWKGCQWGCFLRSAEPHSIVESAVGIPQALSRFADTLFERLSVQDVEAGRHFAVDFFEAITPGASLAGVPWLLFDWLLTDREEGALRLLKEGAEGGTLLASISEKCKHLASASDLALALARDLDLASARTNDLASALALARDFARASVSVSDLARDLDLASVSARDLASALARARDLASVSDLASDLARDLARDLDLASVSDLDLACTNDLARARARALDLASALALDLASALDLARALASARQKRCAQKLIQLLKEAQPCSPR